MLKLLTRALVRPYRQKRPPRKLVAIVVPLSTRAELTPDEEISITHLTHYLGRYDKFFLAPEGLPIAREGFRVKYFPRRFFGSAAAHGLLLYSPSLYKAFVDYEFIFFYHLDSLVFSDQLEEWCATDIDYIGPPWIMCPDYPWLKQPRVGNGGFTLLRVRRALEVLYSRYRQQPATFWLDIFTRNGSRLGWLIKTLSWLRHRFPHSRLVNRPLEEWAAMSDPGPHSRNNDLFWSDRAVRFVPEFRVATLEQGLRFGFEAAPRKCLELNGGRMPFGCHAWARYDRAVWEPFLLRGTTEGETASASRKRVSVAAS